jgi:hypothetical protein
MLDGLSGAYESAGSYWAFVDRLRSWTKMS